ncbi:hypothetical protein SLE2022_273270 [Rubroshorea leprosula]
MPNFKRKDIDLVNDDFSDFSLSSPATKIRRLDAELPPIIEEEEFPEAPVTEELPAATTEKAVVLFKPVNNHVLHSHSNISVSVDSEIISGFKKQFLQSASMSEVNDMSTNKCRAVVPWVPSVVPYVAGEDVSPPEAPELMEADEMGVASMDIEENDCVRNNCVSMEQEPGHGNGVLKASESFHQWPQQHCMIPQLPQNTFTPITWSR